MIDWRSDESVRRVGIKRFRTYSSDPGDGFQTDSYSKTEQGTLEEFERVYPEGPDPDPTMVLIAEHHPGTDQVRLKGHAARFDSERIFQILSDFLSDEERARKLMREKGISTADVSRQGRERVGIR